MHAAPLPHGRHDGHAAGGSCPELTMDSASLLERLVAFPTVSTASNLDLIGFVETWLGERGFRTTRMPDETGRKANLFASLGPDTGGILLSGHTDVVPVEGQAWTSDPFRLARRGD